MFLSFRLHPSAFILMFKDPFSKIPIKIKLPLGFVFLYLCVMGVGGYFVLNSVYTPLNREIHLRVRNEAITLATLFDRKLESLSRRAEDFSSDGFIRTQTELLTRSSAPNAAEQARAFGRLRQHLRVNKLSIVQEFTDLHIYDLNKQKIIGISPASSDIRPIIEQEFHPEEQRFSGIIPPDSVNPFPQAAIITPLINIQRDNHIGYLVCIFDLALVIEHTSMKYDIAAPESYKEKSLAFVDQSGLTMEIPWWYLKSLHDQESTALRGERAGIKISTGQPITGSVPQSEGHIAQLGQDIFRRSYPLMSTGWRTIIELNATEAMNPLVVLEGNFLGIAGILAITILILLFFMVQYVIRPLGELQRMAHRIKEGDFSARNEIDTEDEIGMLAKTSNLMAKAIQERTTSLEQTAADLQKRERELRMQHNLMNTVIRSMTDGLILMNFRGRVMLSNKAAEPLLDIINQVDGHVDIQKCEYHRDSSNQCVSCMCDPNQATSCVLTIRDTVYEILSTKVPTIHGSSKVLVARNITERELMHQQQAHQDRLTVLGKIAAVVAHEINNPLAAISMYNQMMETELPPSSPFLEHVDVIKRNTETCQHIIRDLLDYARTPQPQIREIDLHELLDNVLQFIRPFYREQSVTIEEDFQAHDAICWGDTTQLQQVFVNLLINAIQAIQRDDGVVRLRTDEDEAALIVYVEDNGPGIDVGHVEDIFEPFFTTKSSGGTGLGLSTSRRIVDAHEGTLELLESRPGKTVFRVTLPRAAERANGPFIPIRMPDGLT